MRDQFGVHLWRVDDSRLRLHHRHRQEQRNDETEEADGRLHRVWQGRRAAVRGET
jgi:hypothetical protein